MTLSEPWALLLICASAALLPMVSHILRLPGAVTEIGLGIVLGQSLLGMQLTGEWLPFLAHLGFLMLMFHAGMEIDFAILRAQSWLRLAFHLLVFGATFILSLVLARAFGFGIFMALVLSTTSLGLVMPTLKELKINKTPLGQSILIAATLADFLTLLGITLFLLYHRHGIGWQFVSPLALFAGFGVFLLIVRRWVWWNPERVARLLGPSDSQELGIRFSLALLFLFVALSELVHVEPVLGAFLGGCVISFVLREKGVLEEKLSAIGFGFLIPIFFIHVGLGFDLRNVFGSGQLAMSMGLLLLALAVKLLPGMLFVFQGVSMGGAFKVGLLLSTRLSLIVAAAAIGVEQGLISVPLKDSTVLVAVITCLLGPTAFKALMKGNQTDR